MTVNIQEQYQFRTASRCDDDVVCDGNFLITLANAKLNGTPYAEALSELLPAICWDGTSKQLLAALPVDDSYSLEGLCDTLARLGLETSVHDASTYEKIAGHGLHLASNGTISAVMPDTEIPNDGLLVLVYPQLEAIKPPPNTSWLSWTMSTMRKQINGAFLASFFVNIVGLALPFFMRYVYDRAIPAYSVSSLFYLGAGVILAIAFGTLFRIVRSRMQTYSAGRLAYLSGTESFGKILSLPLSVLLRSSTNSHILRLRDLERVREFVSGNLATAILDAPFIVIYFIAIGILGGPLVLVPIIGLAFYAIIIPILSIMEDKAMRFAASLNAERSSIQQDTIDKYKDLVATGIEEIWITNFYRIIIRSAVANKKYSMLASALRVIVRTAASLLALATLGIGLLLVLNGTTTPGGLIASMMLIWRITAPVQSFAASFSRYYQLRLSAQQIDRLMQLQGEKLDPSLISPLKRLPATVRISRVVLRHVADRDPALGGVSFQVEEGEVIGITGPNGSGKTTLLSVITGLLQPQAGSVQIGGRDIRQFSPEDLRSWLGFMPENDTLFRGTLRSNMLLAKAGATDENIKEALKEAGAGDLLDTLSHGLDTFMVTERGFTLPQDMQQAVCIARMLLKKPPLLVMDTPIFHGEKYMKNFLEFLNNSRGNRTIIVASHDIRILERCDKVLILDRGEPISFGKIASKKASDDNNSPQPPVTA